MDLSTFLFAITKVYIVLWNLLTAKNIYDVILFFMYQLNGNYLHLSYY